MDNWLRHYKAHFVRAVNYQVKKLFILLFSMVTVIGISTDHFQGNVAYASNGIIDRSELDNNRTAVSRGNTEKLKAEFAYEMALITAKIVSASATNDENFRIEFAYAAAQATAKMMPMLPSGQRDDFAYDMARITTRIISDKNLDVEKAKVEFAYEMAQLTTKIITSVDEIIPGKRTVLNVYNTELEPKTLLRNNADIEPKATVKVNNNAAEQKVIANPGSIAPETYTGLIDELMHVGDRISQSDNKVNIDGEVRYHYASNSGADRWKRDSSGIRARVGLDAGINQDWRAYGMLEGQKNLLNYNNNFEFSRLYVAGRVGTSMVKAGSFGYLMADGNIYDSDFDGVNIDFGGPVKYTMSYGETDETKRTYIMTAQYHDFDYNLEAGVYRYQMKRDDGHKQYTIGTLGGNYNFSDFGLGAMVLSSSQKDSKGDSLGYVVGLNYSELKTWRPGTYGIFAKYYNQPRYTFIAHGMNGIGGRLNGFKGTALGVNYTFAENVVGGIEYYDLTDKITGEQGDTWWSQITHYF
ncbi:MAG: hypothetical protein PHQ46_08795 [Negativicutes bacterium]|nr:hypothetical protein [Negativicutes bacterium]